MSSTSPIAQMPKRYIAIGLERLRVRGRAGVARSTRLTGAAVVAWLVAHWLYPNTLPLLAPLTALLVVQLTLTDMIRHGFDRVASVLIGVGVAIGFSTIVGLTWWSLGLLIAVSLLAGQILRVGPNLLEVPISAMLVLGVSAGTTHSYAAIDRIAETLVGAIVGVCINFFLPPGVRTRDAGKAIERFAENIASLTDKAADEISTGVSADQARGWLHDARNFSNHTPGVDRALVHAEESRRMNVRAIGTRDSGPSLRFALDSLEHSSVSIRSMFRAISDGVLETPSENEPFGEELRRSMSGLLADLATSIRCYGLLTNALAHGNADDQEAALVFALEQLRSERETASQLLATLYLGDARLRAVNVYVISTADRVLQELDLAELKRRHDVVLESKPVIALPMPLPRAQQIIRNTGRQLAERRFGLKK